MPVNAGGDIEMACKGVGYADRNEKELESYSYHSRCDGFHDKQGMKRKKEIVFLLSESIGDWRHGVAWPHLLFGNIDGDPSLHRFHDK